MDPFLDDFLDAFLEPFLPPFWPSGLGSAPPFLEPFLDDFLDDFLDAFLPPFWPSGLGSAPPFLDSFLDDFLDAFLEPFFLPPPSIIALPSASNISLPSASTRCFLSPALLAGGETSCLILITPSAWVAVIFLLSTFALLTYETILWWTHDNSLPILVSICSLVASEATVKFEILSADKSSVDPSSL